MGKHKKLDLGGWVVTGPKVNLGEVWLGEASMRGNSVQNILKDQPLDL